MKKLEGQFVHINQIKAWLEEEKDTAWIDPRYIVGYDKEKVRKTIQINDDEIDVADDDVIVDYLTSVMKNDSFYNEKSKKYFLKDIDIINALVYLISDLHSVNTPYQFAWFGSYLFDGNNVNINFQRIYTVFKYEKNEHVLNLLRIFILETFELNITYPYLSAENITLFEKVKNFSTPNTYKY